MTAKLSVVQKFGDERDDVVVLKAPGKPAPDHPATGQMSKAFDWLVHFRHYMAVTDNNVLESDKLACEAIYHRTRSQSGKGKQWTRDGKRI